MKSIDKFVLVLVASLALLLAGCGGGSSTAPVDPGPTEEEMAAERAQMQTAAIMTASMAVDTALAALSGSDPTQAQIDDVNTAIGGLQAALAAAADVDDAAKAGYQSKVTSAQTTVMQAEAALMAVNDAAAEAARMAMAAMTAKLWAGLGETPLANNGASTAIADDGVLTVQRGATTATPLAENEDTTVASLHGWEGSEHTATVETAGADNIGTYTAQVYSNVGEPTEGAMFNDSANGGYTLDSDGKIADVASLTGYAGLVDSPSFDQPAGTKTFELPTNTVAVMIPGSFNGVAGTYGCTPSGGDCSATVAPSGFTLGNGTWTFTPTDPETRLMNTPDNAYAVYGWWLHETASGAATVSAFFDYRGTAPTVDIANLSGTATYKGGAAGKYAVSAGAHNDSGHFTADAELKAEFNGANAHMISGTISNFMGSDDMPRDWSVALKEGTLGTDGAIAAVTDGTTWTMGGTDAADSGQWEGMLHEETTVSGVPSVGIGKFHSEYGNTGRMVGAFGVDLED